MTIRELRKEQNLTLAELCKMVRADGVYMDVALLSKIENGLCFPTPEALKSILRCLQKEISDFLTEGDTFTALNGKALKSANKNAEMVSSFIPIGKENAIRRSDLRDITGMTDRELRRVIEEARAAGVFICNDQDGRGYYISTDTRDLLRQYKADTSRALTILTRRKPIRDYLIAQGVQV